MNGDKPPDALNIFRNVVDEDPSDNPLFWGGEIPDSWFCFLNGNDMAWGSNFDDNMYAAQIR